MRSIFLQILFRRRFARRVARKRSHFHDLATTDWLTGGEYIQIYGMALYKIGEDGYFFARPSARTSDRRDIRTYAGLSTDHIVSGMSSHEIAIAIFPFFV